MGKAQQRRSRVAFEAQYSTKQTEAINPKVGSLDSDGDGVNNTDEIKVGPKPVGPTSKLLHNGARGICRAPSMT